MDWDEYRPKLVEEARRQGQSEARINEMLAYAEPLATAQLPIIYDFTHLAILLGFDENVLRNALKEPSYLYISYRIPKHGVGYRQIDEPVPSLKEIQRWILRAVLNRCAPHDAATAFCRRRSIRENAAPHTNEPMVLSLDVKDFFPSIRENRIFNLFRRLGYSSEVAEALKQLSVLRNGLPQGAPTSPALSNLIMVDADRRLAAYAARRSIYYSRYADDITFSGKFAPGEVISMVRRVLSDVDLALNEAKTRLMLRHQRQLVTGVVVNERLQANREIRRNLRQEIYYIKRFGLDEHEGRRPSLDENSWQRLRRLRGIADFILSLNPDDRDARNAIAELEAIRLRL